MEPITTNTTNTNYMQGVPSIVSSKEFVICKPPALKTQEKVGSIASLMTKTENLEPLEVLFNTSDNEYRTTDKVFLRAESYEHNSLRKVYYIDGTPFVLLERSLIIACQQMLSRLPDFMQNVQLQPQMPQQVPQYLYPSYYPFTVTCSSTDELSGKK